MPELDTPIDIDRELSLTLPGSSVYCFDGIDATKEWPVYPEPVLPGDDDDDSISEINIDRTDDATYDLQGRRVLSPSVPGLYIRSGNVIRL